MALCKLGRAYRALGRSQYSLYFFEQAVSMADDYDFADVRMMADYHQACIQCTSTQLSEIESAQKALGKLIPFFEKKIAEHNEENSHCPKEYHDQLSECYDGMLTVLAKMGDKEEALQYAEAHRYFVCVCVCQGGMCTCVCVSGRGVCACVRGVCMHVCVRGVCMCVWWGRGVHTCVCVCW